MRRTRGLPTGEPHQPCLPLAMTLSGQLCLPMVALPHLLFAEPSPLLRSAGIPFSFFVLRGQRQALLQRFAATTASQVGGCSGWLALAAADAAMGPPLEGIVAAASLGDGAAVPIQPRSFQAWQPCNNLLCCCCPPRLRPAGVRGCGGGAGCAGAAAGGGTRRPVLLRLAALHTRRAAV